jgi:cation:H+ antiporter
VGVEVQVTCRPRAANARILAALATGVPAVALRVAHVDVPPLVGVVLFGAGVLAAVALLLWASEAARMDLSGSLALAILALVAILPEYAIDIYFAFTAGSRPEFAAYAAANMTGANRLLIGVAWPLLVFAAIWAVRRRGLPGDRTAVRLAPHRRIEVIFLVIATGYALVIPLTRRLAWYDTVVLAAIFVAYLLRIRHTEAGEEPVAGVAAAVATRPAAARRLVVGALFAVAAALVLASAEPFGRSLIETGATFGIDKFLLVQWLAPIASEAPEVIVAVAFALRGRANDGLGALLAAKLNQWTLLIACLPVAFYLGGGEAAGLLLDDRQTEELVLTAAQTVFGVAVLLDMRITRVEAILLLVLFGAQFVFPTPDVRYLVAGAYAVVAAVLLVRDRRQLPALLAAGKPSRRSAQPS